ncbi:hypothetical protein ACWD5R_29785 [Streptomyces sp. NPDC002514]|uniref:hypothetical protein n=1 Tax=unclassified Streptomyces TaxID=2593676 RepID=UPI003675757B
MRDLRDDERRTGDRNQATRGRVRYVVDDRDRVRRTAEGVRDDAGPGRQDRELDERERLVRMAHVAERPFG